MSGLRGAGTRGEPGHGDSAADGAPVPGVSPEVSAALGLLAVRHGVGARGERLPAWMAARLARALESIAHDSGRTVPDVVSALRTDDRKLAELADVLAVGETSFYRDPAQWDAVRVRVMPGFSRRGRLRALSVGCSTGEEAWTLGVAVAEARRGAETDSEGGSGREVSVTRSPAAPLRFSVVGMDRHELSVSTARTGVYPAQVLRSLPRELRDRYLSPQVDEVEPFTVEGEARSWRIGEELRRLVRFVSRDLTDGPPPGSYEIIFCKNVLIYFGAESSERAVRRLVDALAPGGVLVVARSEVPRLRALGCRPVDLGGGVVVFSA